MARGRISVSEARSAFTRNGESRWDVLTNALASSLPPVDNTIALGALVFPDIASTSTESCSAPSAPNLLPALGNVASVVSLMRMAGVNGATPTADAVQVAGAALLGFRAATTARAMVLATDGGPNCNTDLDPRTCRCVGNGCNQPSRCLDDVRTVSRIADLTEYPRTSSASRARAILRMPTSSTRWRWLAGARRSGRLINITRRRPRRSSPTRS